MLKIYILGIFINDKRFITQDVVYYSNKQLL